MQRFAFVPEVPGPVANIFEISDGETLEDCVAAVFVPDLYACPAGTLDGYRYDGKTFTPPEPVVPAVAAPSHRLTSLEFLALFTNDEQTAIFDSSDPRVRAFLWMAGSASYVDLADQRTKDGIAYLVAQKLLTRSRADEISS